MKITENFNLEEFSCNCGCKMPDFVESNVKELAENLQLLRDIIGQINLTNAYRCEKHNAKVGGSVKSQHLVGKAADVQSKIFNPAQISLIVTNLMDAKLFDLGGVGLYDSFTHVDIRGTEARWDNSN